MRQLAAAYLVWCLLAPISWAATTSVSMPALWRYAHPDAKALIGIEWRRIVNSPIGQEIRQKLTQSGMSGLKGMDLIDQIDRVFISSPGNPAGASQDQPPAVIAVQGAFNLDEIRKLAADKMTGSATYHSIEILEQRQKGEDPMALALVDPRTLLLGDGGSVRAAIDHYFAEDPGQAANPLFLRASELAAANDIWVVAAASPSDFSKDGMKQAPFLNDVNRIEAGISLRDGLGLELNLGTPAGQAGRAEPGRQAEDLRRAIPGEAGPSAQPPGTGAGPARTGAGDDGFLGRGEG